MNDIWPHLIPIIIVGGIFMFIFLLSSILDDMDNLKRSFIQSLAHQIILIVKFIIVTLTETIPGFVPNLIEALIKECRGKPTGEIDNEGFSGKYNDGI